MPASRILEGSLPEQHPRAQIFSRAQPQPKTQPERDIKGRSPWLVSSPSLWQMARVAGHGQRESQTIELTPEIIGGAILGLEP